MTYEPSGDGAAIRRRLVATMKERHRKRGTDPAAAAELQQALSEAARELPRLLEVTDEERGRAREVEVRELAEEEERRQRRVKKEEVRTCMFKEVKKD